MRLTEFIITAIIFVSVSFTSVYLFPVLLYKYDEQMMIRLALIHYMISIHPIIV